MPVVLVANKDWGAPPVRQYQSPRCAYVDYNEVGLSALRERRRRYSISEQELCAIQKTLRGDDAKTLKALIKGFQRQQRAVTRVLRWFEIDIDLRFTNEWPIELASEFDREFGAYELACIPLEQVS